jgi:hypothetical protein
MTPNGPPPNFPILAYTLGNIHFVAFGSGNTVLRRGQQPRDPRKCLNVRTCSSNFVPLTTTKVYDYKFSKAQDLYTKTQELEEAGARSH